MELMLPSSSHRFSGSRLWKDCLGGREGLVGRPGFISQGLGVELQPKEYSLYQLGCYDYWLWILPFEFLQKFSHSSAERAVENSREDKVHIAVTVMSNLCVLQLEFRYISVSCRGAWSMFSACTLVWQSMACLQEVQCESCRPRKELHAWSDAFPVSASSLLWTMTVLCGKPITHWACPLLYPSLAAFQHADGCLAHYLGKRSPPVTCDVQGPYQVQKIQL